MKQKDCINKLYLYVIYKQASLQHLSDVNTKLALIKFYNKLYRHKFRFSKLSSEVQIIVINSQRPLIEINFILKYPLKITLCEKFS